MPSPPRAVPDRYLASDVTLDARQYDELEILVGLAFLFNSSVLNRTVAFYPGLAYATESELPLEAWTRVEANPSCRWCGQMSKRCCSGGLTGGSEFSCHLVPIDALSLVGQLRQLWRGFDGWHRSPPGHGGLLRRDAACSRPVPLITEGDVR